MTDSAREPCRRHRLSNDPARSTAELERALETHAYAAWRALDPGPAVRIDLRYDALPATTRELTLGAPRAFLPKDADLDAGLARGDAELVRTSGTTGPPVTLVWSQSWWDASERAGWTLNSHLEGAATGEHREAVLASPRCVGPGVRDRPRTIAERTLGRLLFLNEQPDVARWSDEAVRRMVDELGQYSPVVLEAEPAYLAALCARADTLDLTLTAPQVVVFTYTMPSAVERRRIERALGSPQLSSYGSTETGYVLIECERRRMHHNAASCRVDVISLQDAPDVGRLLVTPFGHPWMCLLRFDVGDFVRCSADRCPCGRGGATFDRIEGRVQEATLASDGRIVTFAEIDDAVAATSTSERIVTYQIEQTREELRLRSTATGELDFGELTDALARVYGRDTRIVVEQVAAIEPEPSGKYARVHQRIALDWTRWFVG